MAEEEKTTEEATTEEGGTKSPIAKLLGSKLFIPIVAVLCIGAGVGTAMLFMGGDDESKDTTTLEETVDKGTEEEVQQEKTPAADEEKDTVDENAPEQVGEDSEEITEEDDKQQALPENEALIYKFEPLVTNIIEKNSIHYLKLQLEFTVSNENVVNELRDQKPILKDRLLFILGDTSLREVLSTGGKSLLKEDILVSFNKILKTGKIKNVYFTEFTVQ